MTDARSGAFPNAFEDFDRRRSESSTKTAFNRRWPSIEGRFAWSILVGARGFEPPTPRSRTECSRDDFLTISVNWPPVWQLGRQRKAASLGCGASRLSVSSSGENHRGQRVQIAGAQPSLPTDLKIPTALYMVAAW